jgi:hypothetical protein
MEVQFTPDQKALISDAIASGRLHHPEEAMQQALVLWEEEAHIQKPKCFSGGRRLQIIPALPSQGF